MLLCRRDPPHRAERDRTPRPGRPGNLRQRRPCRHLLRRQWRLREGEPVFPPDRRKARHHPEEPYRICIPLSLLCRPANTRGQMPNRCTKGRIKGSVSEEIQCLAGADVRGRRQPAPGLPRDRKKVEHTVTDGLTVFAKS